MQIKLSFTSKSNPFAGKTNAIDFLKLQKKNEGFKKVKNTKYQNNCRWQDIKQ